MKKLIISVAFAAMTVFGSIGFAQDIMQIYVSTDGNDRTGDGSFDKPYATIQQAKDFIKSSEKRGKMPIEVIIRGGRYQILEKGFDFGVEDSGTSDNPVTYKSFENEKVIISGGIALTEDMFDTVTNVNMYKRFPADSRDKIKCVDLKQLGITGAMEAPFGAIDYTLPEFGDYGLYADGEKLESARWPNDGYTKIANVSVVGGKNLSPVIGYADDRIEKWENITDVFVWGQWNMTWRPSFTNIKEIDKENKLITLNNTMESCKVGNNYYYYNVPEELDVPGEYYIDRTEKKLYIYPTGAQEYMLSYLKDVIFDMKYAKNIVLKGLTVEGSRGYAVRLSGCKNITVDGCEIRNISYKAIYITEGSGHKIINNDLYELDYGAVYAKSGDDKHLISCDLLVENNHIYKYDNPHLNYVNAISFWGCGLTMRHNLIHDSYGMAISISGPDNLFEYNELYNLSMEADDCAICYNVADMRTRDTVYRYNMFYNSFDRKALGNTGTFAIYWDGMAPGRQVYGNVFYNLNRGVFINCGGFQQIENNIFVDVDNPIRSAPGSLGNGTAYEFWFEFSDDDPYSYMKGVWKDKYPEYADMFYAEEGRNRLQLYRNNVIGDNIMYKCGENIIVYASWYGYENDFRDNIVVDEDIFEDSSLMNFNIKEGKVPENFDNIIDVGKIGLTD